MSTVNMDGYEKQIHRKSGKTTTKNLIPCLLMKVTHQFHVKSMKWWKKMTGKRGKTMLQQ